MLDRNHMALSGAPDQYTLHYALTLEDPKNGLRRAQWVIRLLAPTGQEMGRTEYTSTLTQNPSPRSIEAFTEAATLSALRSVNQWLQKGVTP